jgi:hypothetical protein
MVVDIPAKMPGESPCRRSRKVFVALVNFVVAESGNRVYPLAVSRFRGIENERTHRQRVLPA